MTPRERAETRKQLLDLAEGMDSGEYVADPSPYHAELVRKLIAWLDESEAVREIVRERDEARAHLHIAGKRADEAERREDAARERIAELEAALRETLLPLKALHLADGHNWSPAVREQFAKAEPMALAALSAPAQPATAVELRHAGCKEWCGLGECPAVPSPAALEDETRSKEGT